MTATGHLAAGTGAPEQLGDMPIDDVLGSTERDLPGYRALYYLWERQQWEAGSIDLTEDRRQWADDFSPALRRSLSWVLSSSFAGKEQLTDALVPFVDAAPTEEQQVFLTTQLADNARHTVFFDRVASEVRQGAGVEPALDAPSGGPNEAGRLLLSELLPAVSRRIRRDLTDMDALVEGVVLHHLVIVGTLALTGHRFLSNFARDNDLAPGLRGGVAAMARDESRHVAFGIRFLTEMVAADRRYATVVESALGEYIPVGLQAIAPPDGDMSYCDPLNYGPGDLTRRALNSLGQRLAVIGVELPG